MSKVATIASLVRAAAKEESEFVSTIVGVFEEDDPERIAEFFDRLNIPRSQGAEGGLTDTLPDIDTPATNKVWGFEEESEISKGMQRFLDRHERKIKWHASHPSIEGTENVLLLFRAATLVTNLRLRRLRKLLGSKDELTPQEWAIARELTNRTYLSFRNFLSVTATDWIEAVVASLPREELGDKLGNFYEIVDKEIRWLEEQRNHIEERRQELTVVPEGFPPVKPPNYFGGDLLGRGPWKQYWASLNARAHAFREALG